MSRKKTAVGIITVAELVIFGVLFFIKNVGGQNLEKKIIGQWAVTEGNTGCETDLENGIRINGNGTIEGIDGFKKYEIEETEQGFSYLIASGGYEDITR